jgi:hypothetical protein
VTGPARRRWQAHPAAEQDLIRLGNDHPRLPLRAIALLDLIDAGRLSGTPLADSAFYGDLSDCFKFYFGLGEAPTHRLVYRSLADGRVEVLELIAAEQREHGYVYLLASKRLGRLPVTTQRAFDRIHQTVIRRRGTKRTPDT